MPFTSGFLFLDEDDDAYLVALTCRNPKCAQPRTAIRLREKDFLSRGETEASRRDVAGVGVPRRRLCRGWGRSR